MEQSKREAIIHICAWRSKVTCFPFLAPSVFLFNRKSNMVGYFLIRPYKSLVVMTTTTAPSAHINVSRTVLLVSPCNMSQFLLTRAFPTIPHTGFNKAFLSDNSQHIAWYNPSKLCHIWFRRKKICDNTYYGQQLYPASPGNNTKQRTKTNKRRRENHTNPCTTTVHGIT